MCACSVGVGETLSFGWSLCLRVEKCARGDLNDKWKLGAAWCFHRDDQTLDLHCCLVDLVLEYNACSGSLNSNHNLLNPLFAHCLNHLVEHVFLAQNTSISSNDADLRVVLVPSNPSSSHDPLFNALNWMAGNHNADGGSACLLDFCQFEPDHASFINWKSNVGLGEYAEWLIGCCDLSSSNSNNSISVQCAGCLLAHLLRSSIYPTEFSVDDVWNSLNDFQSAEVGGHLEDPLNEFTRNRLTPTTVHRKPTFSVWSPMLIYPPSLAEDCLQIIAGSGYQQQSSFGSNAARLGATSHYVSSNQQSNQTGSVCIYSLLNSYALGNFCYWSDANATNAYQTHVSIQKKKSLGSGKLFDWLCNPHASRQSSSATTGGDEIQKRLDYIEWLVSNYFLSSDYSGRNQARKQYPVVWLSKLQKLSRESRCCLSLVNQHLRSSSVWRHIRVWEDFWHTVINIGELVSALSLEFSSLVLDGRHQNALTSESAESIPLAIRMLVENSQAEILPMLEQISEKILNVIDFDDVGRAQPLLVGGQAFNGDQEDDEFFEEDSGIANDQKSPSTPKTSKRRHKTVVKFGLDEDLDQLKRFYRQLPEFLSGVLQEMSGQLFDVVKDQIPVSSNAPCLNNINLVYYPQLGFLLSFGYEIIGTPSATRSCTATTQSQDSTDMRSPVGQDCDTVGARLDVTRVSLYSSSSSSSAGSRSKKWSSGRGALSGTGRTRGGRRDKPAAGCSKPLFSAQQQHIYTDASPSSTVSELSKSSRRKSSRSGHHNSQYKRKRGKISSREPNTASGSRSTISSASTSRSLPIIDSPELEFQFSTTDCVFYKSPRMHQLDQEIGDIYTLIIDRELEILQALQTELKQLALNRSDNGFIKPNLLDFIDWASELDALMAVAQCSFLNGWCKPKFVDDGEYEMESSQNSYYLIPPLDIKNGFHPVQSIYSQIHSQFQPNSTKLGGKEQNAMIITGPNGSGKSVYLKQVGLIVYLAHCGVFVPAESCKMPRFSGILTRIQTKESCISDKSAFKIDLEQVQKMLKVYQASHSKCQRFLMLIDEFGKGTNSSDGIGLLSSVLNEFTRAPSPMETPTAANIGSSSPPYVLVSTHYHQLFNYFSRDNSELPFHLDIPNRIKPVNMQVKVSYIEAGSDGLPGHERLDDNHKLPGQHKSQNETCFFRCSNLENVEYTYKLVPGICNQSLGSYCAKISGLSEHLVERADKISADLYQEEQKTDADDICIKPLISPVLTNYIENCEKIMQNLFQLVGNSITVDGECTRGVDSESFSKDLPLLIHQEMDRLPEICSLVDGDIMPTESAL